MELLQNIKEAELLKKGAKRLLITACGFEERSLGWSQIQKEENILHTALIFRYKNSKIKNKLLPLKKNLKKIGIINSIEFIYDANSLGEIEKEIETLIYTISCDFDEIILDITSFTKFLILIILLKLSKFNRAVRIVYTEAITYAPTFEEFKMAKDKISKSINFPSKGFGRIQRAKCLSSIRMQGQPVTLVAFTSFNEQLVMHMLGTINPHRLLFINGIPSQIENSWREDATLFIHKKLIGEYSENNKYQDSRFERRVSTFNYIDTIEAIEYIYKEYGLYERIIVAATGSKMQTVGLFFSKILHPDIHIEYPTPDSYYIKGFSSGIKKCHELYFNNFNSYLNNFSNINKILNK